MDNTEKRIADVLASLQFERRPPASKLKKAQYAALEAGVGDALRALNRLHLRLWHAVTQRDYRSLPLEETRRTLEEIQRQLGVLSQEE
jgi:hypothetical protein